MVCVHKALLWRTVKVAGVVLGLQLRYEFSFLPQEAIPVQTQEERVHLYLRGSTWAQKVSKTGFPWLSIIGAGPQLSLSQIIN